MEWENYDINVIEQANIPKFSKLDDIVTPIRLFELFFDDALIGMLGTPSCTVRERKQTLVLKLLIKRFTYLRHGTA